MAEESVYSPSPWQTLFHSLPDREVLGAGSAGPGKSMALLMDPISQVHQEHQRCLGEHDFPLYWGESLGWALHLRRTRPMLALSIARSKRIFPKIDPMARWLEKETMWIFQSGYRYQFGHCADPDDWDIYQSNEYCAAGGTPVLMADGSWRPIESVVAGEYVQTLAGPMPVLCSWATGVKPCVLATTRYQGEIVGTQLHPTTHPVLLWPSDESHSQPSLDSRCTAPRVRPHGMFWQDYESLLCGRPESPVGRVSLLDAGSVGRGFGMLYPGGPRLGQLSVPVALHEPTVHQRLRERRTSRGSQGELSRCESSQQTRLAHPLLVSAIRSCPEQAVATALRTMGATRSSLGAYGVPGVRTGLETRSGSPVHCSPWLDPRDGRSLGAEAAFREHVRRRGGAASRSPIGFCLGAPARTPQRNPESGSFYPHFYSGRAEARTEAVLRGEARMEFAGWHETYDLTVGGANHYITESGMASSQTWIGYDELVQFLQEQYDQINTRLRSSDPVFGNDDLNLRKIRSCSNPILRRATGDGSYAIKDPYWVRKRFVDPAPQGKVRMYTEVTRRDGTKARVSRVYLPATIYDNPDQNFVRQYEVQLLTAPLHIRKPLLHGDWYGVADSYFSEYWDPRIHVCEPFKIPDHWPRFRSMDWGFKKPGCVHWWALDDDGNLFCEREFTFQGMLADEVAKELARIERKAGYFRGGKSRLTGPADSQLWEQRGDVGKTKAETFADEGFQWEVADKRSRATNAERVANRLKDHQNYTTTPGVVIFNKCKMLITTLPAMQIDPDDVEAPKDGGDDHWYDSMAYACAYASYGEDGIPGKRLDEDDDEPEDDSEGERGSSGYGEAY